MPEETQEEIVSEEQVTEGLEDEQVEGTDEPEETPEEEPEDEPGGDEENPEGLTPLEDDEPEEKDRQVPVRALQREREKRREAERRAAEAERRAAEGTREAQAEERMAPKESDYDDPNEYLVARAKHESLVEYDRREALRREEARRREAEAAQRQLLNGYESKVDEAIKKDPDKFKDYEDAESFVVSAGMDGLALRSLMTAERPAHIVRYLAKNPAKAERIASLPPLQQVEEIGYLKKRSMMVTPKKKTTQAAQPISPERGDSSPPKKVKFSKDMSEEDYSKLMAQAGDDITLGDLGAG